MKSVIKLKYITQYFLMIPAIAIGTRAMIDYNLPLSIWIQNIISWFIMFILGLIFIVNKNKSDLSKNNFAFNFILTILIILLLLIPFLFKGLDGVYRWAVFGQIRFYVASIFLPLIIVLLCNLLLRQYVFQMILLSSVTLAILLFHPDASQVTAFAVATIFIMCRTLQIKTTPQERFSFLQEYDKLFKIIYLIFATCVTILSWILLDSLAPVAYVEEILFLVADKGYIWLILAIVSLILLLLPFFIFYKNIISISLGIYFFTIIITTFFGNFPMPIMGYGVSPIIGYSIALILLSD